jgi:predicted Zn-dependent protease with MMP-like domain
MRSMQWKWNLGTNSTFWFKSNQYIRIEFVPHRKHYLSAIEPNRLMLFGETVAVYCENHTEHIDTVRTPHETHYFSTEEPNRLMLFRETVAVYCENHTEHIDTLWGQNAEF